MSTSNFRSLVGICLFLSLTGCGGLKDMQDNAKAASDNSGKAADAAEESREEIANARILGRAGEASQARREAVASLMSAQSFEHKATEASKYVKAFEYQMFTGQRYDTESTYEIMLKDTMEEFFRSLVELNGDQSIVEYDFSPFSPFADTRSQELNVYAVAAALHKVHHYRESVGKEPPASLFDVLSTALSEISKVEAGQMSVDDLKSHQVVVYRNYEEAIALMQARMNMIMIVALGKFSDRLDKTSTLIGAKIGLSQEASYEVGFMDLNRAQKDYILLVLDYASETAEVLNGQGYEPEFLGELTAHYNTLTFHSISEDSEGFQSLSIDDQQLGKEFVAGVKKFFPGQ
ncbi:MAG: hypothetical protein AAF202_08095 [Pseudomonadota bacterium]